MKESTILIHTGLTVLPLALIKNLTMSSIYALCEGLGPILEPLSIGFHYPYAMVVVPVDGGRRNRIESFWENFPQAIEGVVAVLPSVPLALTPVPFDKIQLAVDFWIEDDVMAGRLNFFLHLTFLCTKVGLLK